jgi:ribosome-binding factor A
MAGWRPERVAEMVHKELSWRLRQEIKDPDLGDVSITRVEVTKDLGRAVVSFLPLGGGPVTKAQQEALDRAARQLRGPIGRALRLRTAPELVFRRDEHIEEAVRLTSLLDEIGRELREGGDDEDDDGEASP